jgi:hypothetical protein
MVRLFNTGQMEGHGSEWRRTRLAVPCLGPSLGSRQIHNQRNPIVLVFEQHIRRLIRSNHQYHSNDALGRDSRLECPLGRLECNLSVWKQHCP